MRSPFAPLALAVLCSHLSLAQSQAQPSSSPAPTAVALPVSQALTLRQALRLTLTHNPDLAAARLELQAMEAAEIQAGARPNPELGLLVEDTRGSSRTTTLQWSQPIELGPKRAARLEAAARAREQAAVALQAKQAELRAAVSSGFFEVLGAQEQVKVGEAMLELARNASSIATKRLQAGKVPPLEQAKAQVAEAGVRAEWVQAQSELVLARQRLASLWGQGQGSVEQIDGRADLPPEPPSATELAERMAQAPAVRLARLDIAKRQAQTLGERAKRVPDLTFTLGAKRDVELGRTQAVVGLSIPLPLLDSNQGNLLEALRREEQARELLTAVTLRLQADVAQTSERLRQTRQQALTLRTEVLPTAQSAYDAAVKGYELSKFSLMDVLDAQRTLFQLRQQQLRSSAEAYRASAELDRLLAPRQDDLNQE